MSDLIAILRQPWSLQVNAHVDVLGFPASLGHGGQYLGKDATRFHILPPGIGIGKEGSDIRASTGAQQSIADSMEDHVTIGMSDRTVRRWNLDATEDQRSALFQPMAVGPDPDANLSQR